MSSITVCVTTCYGKKQLLSAVRSIRNSNYPDNFKFVVVADSVRISSEIKSELKKLQIELIENKKPTSAYAKARQVLATCKTDYFLITQDDMLFSPDLLQEVVRTFDHQPDITFIGTENVPLKPTNFIQAAINVGTRLNNKIGKYWNKGDNYLAMLGRLMAFRTDWLKSLDVHDDSISVDAYLYFEDKAKDGKYQCLWGYPLYFRNPDNLEEQMRKSSRFQNSYLEMKSYKKFKNLEKEYRVPKMAILRASVEEMFAHPIDFIGYIGVFLYTRLAKEKAEECLTPLWEPDISTKSI